MNLDNNLLHTLRYFKTFEESKQDKYFREKLDRLSKLNMSSYNDLMNRYVIKAASGGSVDMNEFDRDIDELLKEDKTMTNEEVTQEVESFDWIDKIYYLVDKVDSLTEKVDLISEVVLDCVEEELEPDSDCLDTYAYKAKVLANNEIEMIKIGKIDSYGKLELFPVETYPPISFRTFVGRDEDTIKDEAIDWFKFNKLDICNVDNWLLKE